MVLMDWLVRLSDLNQTVRLNKLWFPHQVLSLCQFTAPPPKKNYWQKNNHQRLNRNLNATPHSQTYRLTRYLTFFSPPVAFSSLISYSCHLPQAFKGRLYKPVTHLLPVKIDFCDTQQFSSKSTPVAFRVTKERINLTFSTPRNQWDRKKSKIPEQSVGFVEQIKQDGIKDATSDGLRFG